MTAERGSGRFGTGPGPGLASAVGFLTVVGPPAAPVPSALAWFPLVGAALGGVVGAAWWGAGEIWPPVLAAVVAVAADAVLTGALHHDGLADAADGLLPHMDRARRLAVMRQPDVGAFGVLAVVLVVALQSGALAGLEPHAGLVAALWCTSRTSMAVAARTVPYARPEGLASSFLGGPWAVPAVVGLAVAVPLAAWSAGAPGVAAVASTAATAGLVVIVARRRVGGFTGDVLGAAGLAGQTVGLLVAAARW